MRQSILEKMATEESPSNIALSFIKNEVSKIF